MSEGWLGGQPFFVFEHEYHEGTKDTNFARNESPIRAIRDSCCQGGRKLV